MLALATTFVTSCGDAASHRDAVRPHDGGITRPGVVLVAAESRARTLAALPAELRARWCPAFDGRPPAMVQRLQSLPDGPDTSAEPFALAIMEDAGAALAGDRPAATRAARLLDRWARLGALRPFGPPDVNRNYALDRALLPMLVAVGLLRDDPALAEGGRERVVNWLGTLIRSRPRPAAASITRRNNHHYLRGSVDAAWGALTGDAASFAAGLAAYRDAIGDLRPDGSLPLETARGPKALWYQRHALASLVVIAEIADHQGIDLYGYSVDGRDLHRAVRFLLDAIADPKLVQPYSGADGQDLSFLQRRGHHRNYMAWAEIYAARFPERAESARLLGLAREADPDFRPMIDDYSGGNTTCLFAAP